ncbi:MAG: histidine kinase [Bryobacteraceae bacterium]
MPGKLTIVLGYAAGVGKTYRMLDEGQKLIAGGHDVAIGYFEAHGRADTIARTAGMETIPRRSILYRGKLFEEMDPAAIIARQPEICLVDEFPHTNIPGSERAKRWEDVLALLDAGIDVITTMNVQHIESLNDQVREVSGVPVRETVPDWVVKRADEVVLVDLTPEALLNRLDRGVVYPLEKARRAKENFFKEPVLAALREMALRQTAHEVEVRQEAVGPVAANTERILIHVTESPNSVVLIRRGRRVADYLKAECFAVAIVASAPSDPQARARREALDRHLDFARRLLIETRVLEAANPAEALAAFAYANRISQIFVAKPDFALRNYRWNRPTALMLLRLVQDIQVTFVADRAKRPAR